MAFDGDLLAELEGSNKLDGLIASIEKNSTDFNKWTELLSELEGKDLDLFRKYYDQFLDLYPLCYGYWKKYCDYEIKRGNLNSADTVERVKSIYLRGVKVAPYCVEMWINFMGFASVYCQSESREWFTMAVSFVGTDPKSSKLWDNYVMYETSCNDVKIISALYSRLLSTAFKDVGNYWDPYMAFASQHSVMDLATKEELDVLNEEYDADSRNKMKSDEERVLTLKEMFITAKKARFESVLEDVKKHLEYEKKIRRFYFHVKNVGNNDIEEWKRYLDYELIHGDTDSITVLFERCLIPCARYEEFWLRYLEWAHIASGTEGCLTIVDRCLRYFLPHSVKVLMTKALLIEEKGDYEKTKAYLEEIINHTCPDLLEAVIFYIEFLLRHKDRDSAEELMERFSNEDYGDDANSFIIVYMCNYYWHIRKDVAMTRSIFTSNKDRCQNSLLYWKFYFCFEYSTSETIAESILSLLNDCIASTLSHLDKLVLYELYIQYSSSICTNIVDLTKIKNDYTIWKLAARAQEEPSQKREASEVSGGVVTPPTSIPATGSAMGSVAGQAGYPVAGQAGYPVAGQAGYPVAGQAGYPTTQAGSQQAIPMDPNSEEYAKYYYQQYYQYYGSYPQQATPATNGQ